MWNSRRLDDFGARLEQSGLELILARQIRDANGKSQLFATQRGDCAGLILLFNHLGVAEKAESHRPLPVVVEVVDHHDGKLLRLARRILLGPGVDHDSHRGEGVADIGKELGLPGELLNVSPVIAGLAVRPRITQRVEMQDPGEARCDRQNSVSAAM